MTRTADTNAELSETFSVPVVIRHIERLLERNGKGFKCPWCHEYKLAVHWLEPYLVCVGVSVASHKIPWFRCEGCDEDGTAEYLLSVANGEYSDPKMRLRQQADKARGAILSGRLGKQNRPPATEWR